MKMFNRMWENSIDRYIPAFAHPQACRRERRALGVSEAYWGKSCVFDIGRINIIIINIQSIQQDETSQRNRPKYNVTAGKDANKELHQGH